MVMAELHKEDSMFSSGNERLIVFFVFVIIVIAVMALALKRRGVREKEPAPRVDWNVIATFLEDETKVVQTILTEVGQDPYTKAWWLYDGANNVTYRRRAAPEGETETIELRSPPMPKYELAFKNGEPVTLCRAGGSKARAPFPSEELVILKSIRARMRRCAGVKGEA